MTMETGADRLAALGGMVEEVDGAHPAAVEQAEVQEREQQSEEAARDAAALAWGRIPFTVGGTLAILAPELRQVYTEEACYEWGKAAAAVSKKYKWESPDDMPELALGMATLGFALPSFLIVREKMRELKEGKATGMLAKLGVWWRERKARKAAAKADGDATGTALPAEAKAGGA